jgi:hypothetical protein
MAFGVAFGSDFISVISNMQRNAPLSNNEPTTTVITTTEKTINATTKEQNNHHSSKEYFTVIETCMIKGRHATGHTPARLIPYFFFFFRQFEMGMVG